MSENINTVMIVRDKDGNPKFDDPMNVPDKVMMALSPEDLEYLVTLQREIEEK